jgi:isoquinoline 1-oxidoreductase alpha subunit
MTKINVNGVEHTLDIEADTPLLWVIRDELNLIGTKFGCGMAQCGACTVHLDGKPIRSCVTPVGSVDGRSITTIEGIKPPSENYHLVQQAWIDEQVPQCGYCQSGQIMAAVALLENNPQPNDEQIDQAMAGNVCRCGMYGRIKKAIKRASANMPTVTSEAEEVSNG